MLENNIYVVQKGELESFVPGIGGHGPLWVNKVLEERDLNGEDLRDAREFVKKVIN